MKNLKTLLELAYPLISAVTFEEERFIQELLLTATPMGRDVYVWNIVDGTRKVVPAGKDSPGGYSAPVSDNPFPPAVFHWFEELSESSVLVMCDLQAHFSEPTIVRSVRNTLRLRIGEEQGGKVPTKTVVLLSTGQDLPSELRRQVTVLDYPLPTAEQIEQHLASIRGRVETERFTAIVDACRGLTLYEIENAVGHSLYAAGNLSPAEIIREKREVIRSSRSLEYFDRGDITVKSVGGLDVLKSWLEIRRKAFTPEARNFGLPMPKGLLAVGGPGTGKSLMAKAIAGSWQFPLLRFDIGSAFQKYLGESEAEVRNARNTAEAIAPCVFWVDEIDRALGGSNDSETTGGVGQRILGDLLTWMQEKTAPVVVVATCNSIRGLSSALLRKGRFDEIFFVDLPGPRALKEILDIHLAKRNRDPEEFETAALAGAALGLSGAEVEAAVEDALFRAFSEDREITTADLEVSLREVIPYSVMQFQEAKELQEWALANAKPASSETVDLSQVIALRKGSAVRSPQGSRLSAVLARASKLH